MSQYPPTSLGQNTRQSFRLPALSCLYNSSDVSCHLPCIHSVLGAKLGALHTLALSLPYEVDNVILILQPKKWSLREACVPKDTQLVNGETRIETPVTPEPILLPAQTVLMNGASVRLIYDCNPCDCLEEIDGTLLGFNVKSCD